MREFRKYYRQAHLSTSTSHLATFQRNGNESLNGIKSEHLTVQHTTYLSARTRLLVHLDVEVIVLASVYDPRILAV